MAEQPLTPGQSYDIKIAGKKTRARVDAIRYQVDINNLTQREVESLPLNGIGLVELTFDEPLVLDPYQQNPVTARAYLYRSPDQRHRRRRDGQRAAPAGIDFGITVQRLRAGAEPADP